MSRPRPCNFMPQHWSCRECGALHTHIYRDDSTMEQALAGEGWTDLGLGGFLCAAHDGESGARGSEAAQQEAYDLETVERFRALATSLFEQGRLARPILQAAYRAVEHSRKVLAHDWLMEFGAELDSQVQSPADYEAL